MDYAKKALSEEVKFTLVARDQAAPVTIVEWIKNSLISQPKEKLHEALDAAIEMANQHEEIRQKVEAQKEENRKIDFNKEF